MTPSPFDVCGPLPTGVTALEASAGTGKTFTIAALVARYVAEGLPLDQLLAVTFTRMATGELRERVRDRLVTAEAGLAAATRGAEPDGADDVLRLLAGGSQDEVAQRRARLALALTDFDAATIATTHGFCEHVLAGFGIGADIDTDSELLEDPRELVHAIAGDLFLRRYANDADLQPEDRLPFGIIKDIAEKATLHGDAAIAPTGILDEPAATRVRLAERVRQEFEQRKRRQRVLTFDDVLARLAATLANPVTGPAACRRLRERYRVVLVDEFQDTDPVQWEVLRRAFVGDGGGTLVLIADPKQAIYSFRGADVHAYLDAAASASTVQTLAVNWRSDAGLLAAYDAVFAAAELGRHDIAYRPVRAAAAHQAPGLVGAPVPAALRVRVVHRKDGLVELTPRAEQPQRDSARAHIAEDLAAEVVRLLSSGAEIVERDDEGEVVDTQRIAERHIAVLVRKHTEAELVHAALARAGVAAIVNGGDSVFRTQAAKAWLALLAAIEQPQSATHARAVALTPFFGLGPSALAEPEHDRWEIIHTQLHEWAALLRSAGVATVYEHVSRSRRLLARVLSQRDGERMVTDLEHLAELLHAESSASGAGAPALVAWLRRRIAEAEADTRAEDRTRRLESESDAVAVITIHRAKGLEFPVVCCPYLWIPEWEPDDPIRVFHDPARGGRRTLDVGGRRAPDAAERARLAVAESRAEDLRLAYVALTRARNQALLWWAGGSKSGRSALTRLLLRRAEDGSIPPDLGDDPVESEVVARLEELAAQVPGHISVERTTGGGALLPPAVAEAAPALERRLLGRDIDGSWRRTSYSGLTAGAWEARVASEPEDTARADDEPAPDAADPVGAAAGDAAHPVRSGPGAAASLLDPHEAQLRARPALLADLPGGTEIGHIVHAVLEHADFTADDLDAELRERLAAELAWRRTDIGSPDQLVAGLRAAIETPWGPDGQALRDLQRADRLNELDFELPLAGGDAPTGSLSLPLIAQHLRDHLEEGDPLAGYADSLDAAALPEPLAASFRGYLAGSIDLVARFGTRFVVVDHKTNWLGVDGEPLSAWHYRPAALADAMRHGHYPLQALLYQVALHRYLRWRLPGYDPAEHLGGAAYLFVRGMLGADAPTVDGAPCGAFLWRPPVALITGLSDLLHRGVAA